MVAGGRVLGAEVVEQERRRRALALRQAQQLDVASGLLAPVAHDPEVAVVLDANVCRLDPLGQIPGQAVRDLLVQTSLEAILRAVAQHAQRVVRDGRASVEVARVVGLGQIERLAPRAPGQRAQLCNVLLLEHLVGVQIDQPVAARGVERHVACLGERPGPLALDDRGAEGPGDLDRRVGRARVDEHDLIDRPSDG